MRRVVAMMGYGPEERGPASGSGGWGQVIANMFPESRVGMGGRAAGTGGNVTGRCSGPGDEERVAAARAPGGGAE